MIVMHDLSHNNIRVKIERIFALMWRGRMITCKFTCFALNHWLALSIFELPCCDCILEQSAQGVLWALQEGDAANKQTGCCLCWVHQHSSLSVKNNKHEMADLESVKVSVNSLRKEIVKPTLSFPNGFHDFMKQEGARGIVVAYYSIYCSSTRDILHIMQTPIFMCT